MSLPECAEPVSRKRKDGDHFAAPRNSIDHIIEVYKRDADVTLIDECLSRTVEQRLQALEDMMNAVEELRAGVLDLETLIATKRAADRAKDFEAVAELKMLRGKI